MIAVVDWETFQGKAWVDRLLTRSQLDCDKERRAVVEIIKEVRERGDEAVLEFTRRFDKAELTSFEVSAAEVDDACASMDEAWLQVIRKAIANIRSYHERQVQQGFMHLEDGKMLGRRIIPMQRVGVYAPGGRALYPSSVLMDVIPAKVAGVKEIILCTPPGQDGKVPAVTLAAAKEAGVDRVFKVGGAQAVAAMALGTASIPRVDKIVGPGNIYVTLAKRELFGYVGIDMVAGPSEVLVVADETARPDYVAADLLSQAEHDPMAAAMLVTPCADLILRVKAELERQVPLLPKQEIVKASLSGYGALIHVPDLDAAMELANRIAPEHLELCVADPFALLGSVQNAGAVFLGHYTPEPLGDYFAGPNHVLPTSGTARFFSALSVEDFVKRTTVLYYSKDRIMEAAADVALFARSEGLEAHARSAVIRLEGEK